MKRVHTSPARKNEPDFVSQQVTEARRYYLNLNPPKATRYTVVCGGMELTQPEYSVQREDFPYYCVEFVTAGRGSVTLNEKRFPLAPGVAFAYAPESGITFEAIPKIQCASFMSIFTGSEAARLLAQTPLGKWKAVALAAPQEFIEIFSALGREADSGAEEASEICATLLQLLLQKLRQRALPAGRSIPRSFSTFEKLRRHVETHWNHLRTVDEIAHECHLTPMYVSRLFRKFAHTGAYEFLMRLKMNRAAELLLDEGLLVKEAAARLEFADAFHFSRAFKRVHGVAPDHFLRSQRRTR